MFQRISNYFQLQPTSSYKGNHVAYNKINQAPEVYNASILLSFEQTKQIIMNIDRLSHSNTLHNQIMKSLNQRGLSKYDGLHKAYMFSSQPLQSTVHIY